MTLRTPTSLGGGAVGTAILVILLSGCSTAAPGGSAATGASPGATSPGSPVTSAPPTAMASTPPAATPAAASAPPAGGLPGTPLQLTQGSAHLAMSGGASETFDMTLSSGILVPDTSVILVWSGSPGGASHDDGLRIQAPSRAGVYQSSGNDFDAPAIDVSTGRIGTAGSPPQFAPTGTECTVTLARVDATGVEGSLRCTGLSSTGYDKPIDVQASFTATP